MERDNNNDNGGTNSMSDFQRDRWGRPLIVPVDGGKPVAYARFSVHGQCLEDRFGLEKWKLRTAGIGLAKRADLFAQVAACPADDNKRLDDLLQAALEAGGSTIGAGLGTALHEFTQRWDQKQLVIADIPEPWNEDVLAYQTAIDAHHLEVVPELIEVNLVHDELKLAGTSDRFYRRSDGRLICADLKTGKSIGPNPLAYIVQLAAYATSVRYDIETGARQPIGDVDTTLGLLVHLPSGKATCDIYEVDLRMGLEAAHVASNVRAWQKRKNIVRKISEPTHGVSEEKIGEERAVAANPSVPAPSSVTLGELTTAFPGSTIVADPAKREWIADRVRAIVGHSKEAVQHLTAMWPDNVPTLKASQDHDDEQLNLIATALEKTERQFEFPFSVPDPTVPKEEPRPIGQVKVAGRKAAIDEGPMMSDADLNAIKAKIDQAPAEDRDIIGRIAAEAAAAKRSISLKQLGSARRFEIVRALLALAPFADDDVLRAITVQVNPDALHKPLGAVIGAFTIAEATNLHDTCADIDAGRAELRFNADGTVEIVRK